MFWKWNPHADSEGLVSGSDPFHNQQRANAQSIARNARSAHEQHAACRALVFVDHKRLYVAHFGVVQILLLCSIFKWCSGVWFLNVGLVFDCGMFNFKPQRMLELKYCSDVRYSNVKFKCCSGVIFKYHSDIQRWYYPNRIFFYSVKFNFQLFFFLY